MKKKIKRTITQGINKILEPVEKSYSLLRKIIKKTQDNIPYLYEEIERIIKSQLVLLERDATLLHNPDIKEFSNIIAKNIAKKLPNIDENKISKIISEKSSKSFLDMLTRGLSQSQEPEIEYTSLKKEKLFKRILIANRGEIALRIIRACRELGIETAIIYQKHNKNTLEVRFADKAYHLNSKKGYLDIEKIIKIAKKAKVDAIHPGYGFLAENSEFARLCEKNKIKFIGPSPKTIELVGNKEKAKKIMAKAGIPVIPGTTSIKSEEEALKIAEKIRFPIIIKASLGGGGRGMRVVRNKKELIKNFKGAQAEAEASFGNKAVYIEKYIENPRHIEFQILADKSGNVIHLGERECSIQRRHQKLIEETPSIALNRKLREKMGNAAIKAAKAVKYVGAGTVEFLLDKKNNFYFMEMNSRIQVEHGITEMVTGVDLIKEQIKIASGATLAYKQDDIKIDGAAIECRINAESPYENFSPQTGTITNYLVPGGPGIRVCSSCHTGHNISPHYDSLIAKLMCKGRNREEAIARMKRALDEFIIKGVETTIPFHKAVLNNKNFIRGKISTNFLTENRILEKLKENKKKKSLSKKEKIIIVTTAVSKYFEEKGLREENAWVISGRKELMKKNVPSFPF